MRTCTEFVIYVAIEVRRSELLLNKQIQCQTYDSKVLMSTAEIKKLCKETEIHAAFLHG